jgi:hypothetical protein
MFKNYVGWHIELTRRCPLLCPACDRTLLRDAGLDLTMDIDVDMLKAFLPQAELKNVQSVLLQGNLGDPIFHPQFHDIAEHFFAARALDLMTNGLRSIDFWQRVLSTWPSHSTITFSIDGLRDTNHLYRKKAKWPLLENLFGLIAKQNRQCKLVWKFIPFEHNYHQIDEARQLAKDLGFNAFRLQRTRELLPEINDGGKLRDWWPKPLDAETPVTFLEELQPFCAKGDIHYVSALGEYFPCCWWSGLYDEPGQPHSAWPTFSIRGKTSAQARDHFLKFSQNLALDFEKVPSACKTFCKKRSGITGDRPNTQIHRQIENFDRT